MSKGNTTTTTTQQPATPPTTTITTTLSNFELPSQINVKTPIFIIPEPTTNNPNGLFTYNSSNTNVIQIYGNTAIVKGIGDVKITATQTSLSKNYTSASITSSLISVLSYINYNNNFTLKLNGIDVTDYNPITNIKNVSEEWIYFKYYINSTHTISSQFNISDNNYFKYKLALNSNVYVLYSGSGGLSTSRFLETKNVESKGTTYTNIYCGGGAGEIALTKINNLDINDNTTINIDFLTNNKTRISYTSNNGSLKSYSLNKGLNGIFTGTNPNFVGTGGSGGASLRSGSFLNNYNGTLGYNNDTLVFGSGSGSGYGKGVSGVYTINNNGTLTNITPTDRNIYGTQVNFNDNNIPSDNTGTATIQYGGNNNNNGPAPFILIFYKVVPQYKNIINNSVLYNKLTNATQISNMYNYNPFNKIIKYGENWVYYYLTNADNRSYIFNLINNGILLDQTNLNNLFETTSKIYKLNSNVNILYIGGGGIGGLAGLNNYYSGGGGGSGGIIKHISQPIDFNILNHNFEIKIGTFGNVSSCIYNTNTNYGDVSGNNGFAGQYVSITITETRDKDSKSTTTSRTTTYNNGTGGNGANGINNNLQQNILGATPGGGGTGNYVNGKPGIIGTGTICYPFTSSTSNSSLLVSLNDNSIPFLTGLSGWGGSNGKNGQNGDSGYCLIYFQVI